MTTTEVISAVQNEGSRTRTNIEAKHRITGAARYLELEGPDMRRKPDDDTRPDIPEEGITTNPAGTNHTVPAVPHSRDPVTKLYYFPQHETPARVLGIQARRTSRTSTIETRRHKPSHSRDGTKIRPPHTPFGSIQYYVLSTNNMSAAIEPTTDGFYHV